MSTEATTIATQLEFYCRDCDHFFLYTERPGGNLCFGCGSIHSVEVLGYHGERRCDSDGVFRCRPDVEARNFHALGTLFVNGFFVAGCGWFAGIMFERDGDPLDILPAVIQETGALTFADAALRAFEAIRDSGKMFAASAKDSEEWQQYTIWAWDWISSIHTNGEKIESESASPETGTEAAFLGLSSETIPAVEGVPVLHQIPLSMLVLSLSNPRERLTLDGLQELADSITRHGVIEPLIVRPLPNGTHEIICGSRRFRAAELAGLQRVPCLVRDVSDADAIEIQLVENLEREQLNPIEEAKAFQKMILPVAAGGCGYSQAELAQRIKIGKDRHQPNPSYISNRLRLLKLPEVWQRRIGCGEMSATHGRILIPYADRPEVLAELERFVMEENGALEFSLESYTVPVLEDLVEMLAAKSSREASPPVTEQTPAVTNEVCHETDPDETEEQPEEDSDEGPEETEPEHGEPVGSVEPVADPEEQQPPTAAETGRKCLSLDYRLRAWADVTKREAVTFRLKGALKSDLAKFLLFFALQEYGDTRRDPLRKLCPEILGEQDLDLFWSTLPRLLTAWVAGTGNTRGEVDALAQMVGVDLAEEWRPTAGFFEVFDHGELGELAHEWGVMDDETILALSRDDLAESLWRLGDQLTVPLCVRQLSAGKSNA